ncbi:MAG: YhcH/YjgK/YiaL family protein [Planctomycetota bacterium]
MIYDTLDHAALYHGIHPGCAEAFAFLQGFDPATPDGRVDLRGDELFANVERYSTQPAATRRYEAHRAYLDIQAVFTGHEAVFVTPHTPDLETVEVYDTARDVGFHAATDASWVELLPGRFAMFFPQDVHKPVCAVGGNSEVLKVVVKIRLAANAKAFA